MWNILYIHVYEYAEWMFASNLSHREGKAKYMIRPTGLMNVLAKIDEVVDVNFLYQASKSQKRDFRDVPGDIKCYSNRNVKFENFMHSEWREERFFKDIVGDKMRLCFWSIASFWGRGVGETKKDDLAYIHLTRYNFMHERFRRYQQSKPGNLTNR